MNNVRLSSYQRGFELTELLMGAVIVVMVSILALKLVPAYMEDQSIKNIFDKIAHDPEMQSASPYDIKLSFSKRATIEGVSVINSDNINIDNSTGALFLSAEYAVKVPLMANVSLYLEFKPSSAR